MSDDTHADRPTDAKLEQELRAVADAELKPETAMAEGKQKNTSDSEPRDPVNPRSHETGQNYLGEETIFTPTVTREEEDP